MAAEEPEVRFDIQLRAHFPLAVGPAGFGNFADPIEHQHWRQGQLRIAWSKQFSAAAGDEVLVTETRGPSNHLRGLSPGSRHARRPQAGLVTQAPADRKRSAQPPEFGLETGYSSAVRARENLTQGSNENGRGRRDENGQYGGKSAGAMRPSLVSTVHLPPLSSIRST